MNSSPWIRGLILITSLLVAGCYNNSHIRTQRVLKPEEKVISGHMGLSLLGPETNWESYGLRQSGISGLRMGLSYLKAHKGYEQGPSLNIGVTNAFENLIFGLGYDIRKVQFNTEGKPYRYGVYLESNNIIKSDYGLRGGMIFQIRPYIISVTSEQRNWYGGLHGLMSFGKITGSYYDYDYELNTERYSEYDYSTSSLGAGVTLGNETRFGDFLFQSQVDISLLDQKHELYEEIVDINDYNEFDPLHHSGPVLTISAAIHRAPPRAQAQKVYPMVTSTFPRIIAESAPTKPTPSYDPITGQLITPAPSASDLQFDPLTGELIQTVESVAFDPYTGLAATTSPSPERQSPYSLLNPREQSGLRVKGLRIASLNGISMTATVLDIMDEGLLINKESYGQSHQEIINYDKINNIRFVSERKGLTGGIKSAFKGCGISLGIPLGITILTGDPTLLAIGIVSSPFVGLGGLIYGSTARDSYDLRFTSTPSQLTDIAQRKQVFVQLVKIYLKSGFPKYDLRQHGSGASSITPSTAEPIQTPEALKFDPITGKAVQKTAHTPISLLTMDEQVALAASGLKIITLNTTSVNATLLDVRNEGLLILNEAYGQGGQQTLFFNRIDYIRFEQGRAGSGGSSTPALFGTKKYGIRFNKGSTPLNRTMDDLEYRKQVLQEFVRVYLASGFPDYDITRTFSGDSP